MQLPRDKKKMHRQVRQKIAQKNRLCKRALTQLNLSTVRNNENKKEGNEWL